MVSACHTGRSSVGCGGNFCLPATADAGPTATSRGGLRARSGDGHHRPGAGAGTAGLAGESSRTPHRRRDRVSPRPRDKSRQPPRERHAGPIDRDHPPPVRHLAVLGEGAGDASASRAWLALGDPAGDHAQARTDPADRRLPHDPGDADRRRHLLRHARSSSASWSGAIPRRRCTPAATSASPTPSPSGPTGRSSPWPAT